MAVTAQTPSSPDVLDARADRAVLRALVHLASLVTGSHDALSTIEAVAETARDLLGAASLSISSRDEQGEALTTLINVGELGPGEVRWPTDERYELTDYPLTEAVLDGPGATGSPSRTSTTRPPTRPRSSCSARWARPAASTRPSWSTGCCGGCCTPPATRASRASTTTPPS